MIVSSFVRDRQYVYCIAYAMQCVLCYCCVHPPSPSNDCTQQPLLGNGCARQHMFCFDMPLLLLALQSLALNTTCAVTTARANTSVLLIMDCSNKLCTCRLIRFQVVEACICRKMTGYECMHPSQDDWLRMHAHVVWCACQCKACVSTRSDYCTRCVKREALQSK